ncbi:MAG: hypothetical protein LIP28_04400 [Deltaproteobacteria bacterium]|nr:hypothetical protein [Deltaproteobacteria bacterium]
MGIDLSTLITRHYPPGNLYAPDIRTEMEPLDPPQSSRPYTSLLDDVVRTGEDMIERANRHWAAGFPARARAGQVLGGSNAFGSRVSPLHMPESVRGRMVAVSI